MKKYNHYKLTKADKKERNQYILGTAFIFLCFVAVAFIETVYA